MAGYGNRSGKSNNKPSGGAVTRRAEDLSPEQLEAIQPEFGGNSRIFNTRRELAAGGLQTQSQLQAHDIESHLQQLAFMSSRGINTLSRNNQLRSGRDGTTRRDVTVAETRRYTAQATRDLRTIYRRANDETRDAWARQVAGTGTNQNNRAVRSIARDLNRRYERIQEADDRARRAERAARRAAQQAG